MPMVGTLLDKPWGPASMTDQKLVYILDDDPDIRTALERLLSMHGYRSCLFASVAEFYAGAKPQQAVCLIVFAALKAILSYASKTIFVRLT
jgi:FixJ family two-component response regulator